VPLEVVTPAALIWLASLLRVGVSAWHLPPDGEPVFAAVLLLLMPALIWREIAAHRRVQSSSQS
jgi:hypothetical protein